MAGGQWSVVSGQRWKNSIVTADSRAPRADMLERVFEIRPEPVNRVSYNGPLEKYERGNVPHKREECDGSTGISGPEGKTAKPND